MRPHSLTGYTQGVRDHAISFPSLVYIKILFSLGDNVVLKKKLYDSREYFFCTSSLDKFIYIETKLLCY